jgi:hypothetical protein
MLNRLHPAEGTVAEFYLKSRGIAAPIPACVRFLPDARTGESAIVGLLSGRGHTTGLQVGYLTPEGEKSPVEPKRRRFNIEKAADAVFEVQAGTGRHTIVAERLEDALSVLQLRISNEIRIVGLPGISTLRSIAAHDGDRFVIVRDGDVSGRPADDALVRGIDYLLLAGATVSVAGTPSGEDANSILVKDGPEALRARIDGRAQRRSRRSVNWKS